MLPVLDTGETCCFAFIGKSGVCDSQSAVAIWRHDKNTYIKTRVLLGTKKENDWKWKFWKIVSLYMYRYINIYSNKCAAKLYTCVGLLRLRMLSLEVFCCYGVVNGKKAIVDRVKLNWHIRIKVLMRRWPVLSTIGPYESSNRPEAASFG